MQVLLIGPIVSLIFIFEAFAGSVTEENESFPLFVGLETNYIQMDNEATGQSLTGSGLGPRVDYAFHANWAATALLKQTFSEFLSTSLLTSIQAGMVYRLSGVLLKEKKKVKLDGQALAISHSGGSSHGVRLEVLASQYFFNSSVTTVPFSGLGAGFFYEREWNRWSLRGGLRVEQLASSTTELMPISLALTIGRWF